MTSTLPDQHQWAMENLVEAPVGSEAEVDALAERHRAWRDRVVALMEEMEVEADDISYFRNLSTFVFRRVDGFNEEHRQLKSIVLERCHRLQNIIRKVEEG